MFIYLSFFLISIIHMYQPFVRQQDINCELPSMDSFHPTHSPVVFMCFFDKNVGMTD